jgi:imidazolonepropionase-like amidohydrolase
MRLRAGASADEIPNLIYEPTQSDRWPAWLNRSEWSVERAVDRVVDAGGLCVKAFVESGFGGTFDWPTPSAETLASLQAEAHRRGLRLLVHANSVDAWRAAISARADVIAHGLWYWPGDIATPTPSAEARDVIHDAAHSGIGVQPTLQVLYGQLSIFDPATLEDPRFAEAMPGSLVAYLRSEAGQESRRALAAQYEMAAPNVRNLTAVFAERTRLALQIMADADVRLLFGSDTPSGDGFGNPPGFDGRLELQRWSEAGVPLDRILRAATIDNARAMGLDDEVGSIAVGKRADLLLMSENPLAHANAFDTIEIVFLNGQPIERATLVANGSRVP